ncbi:hypothetical protein EMIHUDRAFT_94981 [Emiliania huxleyi CCMP1516]|uniref:TRPM SLOG domain-containing protein n=2 Tax=Emiliania huxleyi TaxID=2903 RepID=A0A0D3L164_EMIH1|nr:hypothetical protein EMIHUDRAFT_94981 [Emiliania huxleyi CCMP1516]EOD41749.1 hypothetical protein EMIHUDRAFT_94981 [Emiliania huxleyi CCMP1516]|eukprot:XP_005794178.1 hypothetical protein EMIHUDRAFT_94981 [Emiliania huxleyi CCMP1516]
MASDPELNETRRSFFSRQGLASLMWQPPGADETTTRLPHADDSQADTLVRDAYIKRLGLKMADGGHASWGTVRVLGKNVDAEIVSSEASFACLAADTELNLVAELLKANWRLRPPSVLLSVTGSAQDMALEPHLELLFKRGLAESARSTNAWVITGGTDSGVMALAGAAIAENSSARGELTPCIGIAPFRCVTGKDKLHGPGAGERTVSYRKVRANSTVSAALVKAKSTEHFLMNRVLKLKGYLVQYVVPIPFNMPYMLWDLMWQGVASLGAYCRRAGRRPNAGVLGIKQTRVGIEPVQDLEKPLASPPKKVCFDLADDNEAANGNGAPRPLQRQGTLGRLEASRKLLRQNTRRQLATVRAVKNVRKEASTSVARSVDLTEAHARDRYLKQIEEEGATAADFSQLEVRLRRLEGALTAQLRELASQLEARPALPPRASGACAAQTPSPREMQSAVSGDETAPSRSAVVAGSPLMRFRRGREPSHRSPPPPPPPRPFL